MKIKENKELKLPKIMFVSIWANVMFVLILCFWFMNSVLFFVNYPHLTLIPLGLITFGLLVSYILLLAGPGEAFTKKSPETNFDDFKKSIVYSIISFLVFVSIFQYYKVPPTLPKIVKEETVKITELSIFDKLSGNKLIFSIGYNDNNGNTRWVSSFKDLSSRNNYINTLVENGKFKVKIVYTKDKHNNASLKIIRKVIKGQNLSIMSRHEKDWLKMMLEDKTILSQMGLSDNMSDKE